MTKQQLWASKNEKNAQSEVSETSNFYFIAIIIICNTFDMFFKT